MNPRVELLQKINEHLRRLPPTDNTPVSWLDHKTIRGLSQRLDRGDESVWSEFLDCLRLHPDLKRFLFDFLEDFGWARTTIDHDAGDLSYSLSPSPLSNEDQAELLAIFTTIPKNRDASPIKCRPSTIMYIEEKPGLAGHARIGRVTFSASRKTIYYGGRTLRTLSGSGYKANYFDLESGLHYWISKCKRDGNDTLYPGIIEIDDDAREEYWLSIRKQPKKVTMSKTRSLGKYSKRRPK